jgi:diguanylate cyclase (GGDEF)-like protein
LIDIDHFKAFNDRFGHLAGDKMLKRIVLDIMAAARMSDLTYRFCGEEFVVIADGINADDAVTLGRACPPADRRFARRRLGWRDTQHRDRQLLTRCD